MLNNYKNEDLLILCPNATKKSLLKELENDNKLYQIKFMNIDEFIDNYFYKYDETANIFLMEKYNIIKNVSDVYLKNMYFIDIKTNYQSEKLEDLKNKKLELINNNLLTFNRAFENYISKKKIIIINYPKLEKYIVDTLKSLNATFINLEKRKTDLKVYGYNNIEDELNATFQKIVELIRSGISINNIHILNVQDEYKYLLEKFSKLYNIPIKLNNTTSIFTSRTVKEYLNTKELKEDIQYKRDINNKIKSAINSLCHIKDSKYYEEILKEKLKHTYMKQETITNAIKIDELFETNYSSKDYIFIISFNEGILPTLYKDEDFISDKDKKEVSLYTTKEKNKREKEVLINYLSNIDNLILSYKQNGFSSEYYPSSFINDYNIENIINYNEKFDISDAYNKRKLAILLDKYNKYKEDSVSLRRLLKTYGNSLYNTYNNKFTGLNKEKYLANIRKPLSMSYTSMTAYNQCAFKYYIKYILKIDPFMDNFAAFIGNLYHYLLSICMQDDFDFNKNWDNYLKQRDLSYKELFLLKRLKNDLNQVIEIIKEQKMYTDFKQNYYEEKITIQLQNKEIETEFTGTIDKIMTYKEVENTYYALVDYKTGGYDSSLNNMKYGLGMQLAVYLYLVEKSRLFTNQQFTGFYFQKVLMGNISHNNKKNYQDILNDKLKLDGYSISDESVLAKFDHNYTDSTIIKGMKMTSKGFSRYTKLLNAEDVNNIVNYTEKKIEEVIDNILLAKFDINPKIIGDDNIACKNCTFRDLCYKKEEDYIRLEKLTNYDYIGSDNYGMD